MRSREATQLNREEWEKNRLNQPVRGVVRSVVPSKELMDVEFYGASGAHKTAVLHPYVGASSYLRCMPEPGTTVLMQRRGDIAQPEAITYTNRQLANVLLRAQEGAAIFRELREGEIEGMSRGRAYFHMSEEGDFSFRGGMIEQNLSQTTLTHDSLAPTFHRRLDQHDPTVLGHEERFGLVKRSNTKKPYSVQDYVTDSSDNPYVEYGRFLSDAEGNLLSSYQEGHLIDASQNVEKQSKTNRELRYRHTIGHRDGSNTLTAEVDDDLNVFLNNTSRAKKTELDFGSFNTLKLKSQKFKLSVTQSGDLTFGTTAVVKAAKIELNAPVINLGANAVQPALLGASLINSGLTPAFSTLISALNVLALDPAILPAPTKAALQAAATALSSIVSNFSSALSTQVKLTA